MSIYESIGICWVILTSSLATLAIFYLAYAGFKVVVRQHEDVTVKILPVSWGRAEDHRVVVISSR